MYSSYLAEIKRLPVDLKISRIFRDKSDQLDVKLIQKCLDYTPFENSVVHQTCGQLVKLEKWKDEQGVDIVVGSSTNLLLGTTIKEENRSATPCSDRRWKAEERVLLEDEFDENDCLPEIPPKLPDCELNEYPSWNSQINGIEYSAPDLMLVENDDLAMELMKEVEKYWLFWNSEFNTNFRSARVRELVANRQIYFDKKPSWLFDKDYVAAKQNISNTLLVHRMITNHFYGRIAPKLTYSWCQMMLEQEQMLIEDLALRMDAFLRKALKVSKFDWALEISEMLLDNKQCWIDVLLDDAEKEKFFNSIASLQAFLLRDVVYENIDGLMAELTSCKLNNPFYIKVELSNSDVERHTVWDIVKRIVEIGTDVVRLECRLYPMSYPEQRTFSISSSVIFEKFEVKKVEPFKESAEKLEQLKKDLEALPESKNKVDDALRLNKELYALERKTKLIRVIWCTEPYEFDFTNIKTQLMNTIRECIRTLNIEVTNLVYDQIKKIVDSYTVFSQKLYGVDQLLQMYNLVFTRDEDFPKLKQMVNDLHSKFWKLSDEFLFTEITMQKYYQASRTTFRLAYLADLVWQKLLVDRHKIERQLADRATTMYYEGVMLEDNLKILIKKYRTCSTYSDLKLIANKFQELAARASRISHDYPILLDQLQLFNMDIVKVNAESILKRVNIFAEVSTVHKMVFSFEEIFMNSRVADVHCADVNAEVANLNQRFSDVNKIISEQEVDDALKDSLDLLFAKISKLLDRYNKILPIVNALCGQGMKIHHWRRILCDPDLNENAKETLVVKDLLKINFEGKEKCEEISNLANKELLLEGTLESMQKQWNEITVTHIKNPSTGVYEMEFKNEIVAFIEEQIIKTQMNISSPFSASMLPALKDWLHKLQRLQNIVDTYQKCLAKYTYLEPLFGAEDIAYQMPEEWRVFQEVNAKWKFLGEKLSRTTKFLDLADVSIIDEQEFNYILETFQRIQRGFESYLQKRKLNFYRQFFSFFTPNKLPDFRLYFLSNNELLEMLSRARNPEEIQPYLFKMFGSVARMECKNKFEITAVFSERGEKFKLSKPININHFKRHVDKWLAELERQIKVTVKVKLKNIMRICGNELPSLYDIVGDHTAQIVLLHCRLVFTRKIEQAIVDGSLEEVKEEFETYTKKLQKHQSDSEQERLIIENLLIEISDQLKTITTLINAKCRSIHNFAWTSQLRYYWANEDVYIRVYNLNMLYGYEYVAVNAPFIMTPIIRKVHRELMTFQSQGYAGMLKGPAATGKSESVKELAKILGNFFVVFNCSPQVDRKQLEDLLCGTILSGSTLCLDEFNRLHEEDMAWLASHLLGIYQAQLLGNAKYRIGNLQLPVSSTAAFYLTINPKFLARSSLPANIYSVVRGISMDVADIQSIASAYLLLAGFKHSNNATKLIVNVFEQCQALFTMHHYDFQLRTALATVTEAISLKSSSVEENEVVSRAIRHVLSPCIVNLDRNTFERIISTTIQVPKNETDDDVTKKIITQTIEEMGLVPNEKFVDACFSLFHLSRQRQAFILLGRTLSGKSTMVRVVKRVLRLCASVNCRVFRFNPSQMDSDFLYGHYDRKRLDWIPGLLTQKLTVKLEENEEGWLILDGVLDSIWLETMNSLFDSNKKLCLSNGETVPLKPNIRIIFECDSLEHVAPSTVSRAQVIYMEDDVNPLSTWHKHLAGSIGEKAFLLVDSPIMNRYIQKKIFLERFSRLFSVYKKFDPNDEQLWSFLAFINGSTFRAHDLHLQWMKNNGIKADDVYKVFPTIIGQWHPFEGIEEDKLEMHFKKSLTKQLIQFGNFLPMIYGSYGKGKTKFIQEIVDTFEKDRWEIHLLNLSAVMDTRDLLTTILGCNLIRMGSNHYTGQSDKSVLIILQGMERLQVTSSNSTFEFFRSLYDSGRVLTSSGESIKFSAVHFLADYTIDGIAPQWVPLPERFKRFVFPIYFHETMYSRPPTEKEKEEGIDESSFRDSLVMELQTACRNMPKSVYPLCQKYLKHVDAYGTNEEVESGHEILPSCVLQFEDEEQPSIYEFYQIEKRLRGILSKKRNIEPAKLNLHAYLVRKYAFLYKVVNMPSDGHCILVGEPENDAEEICKMVSETMDCYFETPLTRITETYWRETVIKLVRMCLTEDRKILFFISDDTPSDSGFQNVLADLSVIINDGGMPLRLFAQQQSNESDGLNSTATTSNAQSMEWSNRQEISEKIRSRLHVVISMSKRSVETYNNQFYDLFHYALLVNMDNWMRNDLTSYTTTALTLYCELPKEQIVFCADDLINVHDVMTKLSNQYDHSDFISFVQTYCHMILRKKHKIESMEQRYKIGIQKLNSANEHMNFLQEELIRLQPQLAHASLETTILMSTIERETIEIENAREVVAANESKANQVATTAQALKVECEQELTEAMPALEAAVEALEILNQRDISTLKTMRNPPQAVRLCMEAVCILLGEPPTKTKQVNKSGKHKLDYWPTALKLFSDIHFLHRIRSFEKNKVPPNIIKLIRTKYLDKPEFHPDYIRSTSLAATGLCLWVRAIDSFIRISQIVEPKKLKLRKAELTVKHNLKQLEYRRKALQEVTERLQGLSDQFSQMSQKKQDLQNQISACETKVNRAVKLLSALGSERTRWENNIKECKKESETYKNTVLIGATIIAYLSNVEYNFRKLAVTQVLRNCGLSEEGFTMRSILDHTSILCAEKKEKTVETYVIIDFAKKIPFIIDPHGESQKMLPRLLGDKMMVLDMIKRDILPQVCEAVRTGKTLILDNISEPLPLFVMQLTKSRIITSPAHEKHLQLENNLCEYNDAFRLYFRSDRMESFSVDFLKNVCIINVSLGQNTIEQNIMDLFLDINVSELHAKRDELSDERTKCLLQLDQLEEKILDVLGRSKDLDNDHVINMLGGVKELSSAINARTLELNTIEEQLSHHQVRYIELSKFASRIIYVSMSLSRLSSFYLRNLKFYFEIFKEAVSEDIKLTKEGKIDPIKAKVLNAFRSKILNSLFIEHRSIYDFLTQNLFNYQDVNRMSDKDFIQKFAKYTEPSDLNLREIVFNADSRVPITLLLTAQSTYIVRNIYTFAEQIPRETPVNALDPMHNQNRIQLVPLDKIDSFDWKYSLEDDQWIIVQNCQLLTNDQLIQLESLIDKIAESELRKENFRMFLIIYPTSGEASAKHSLLGKSTVVSVDDDFTFKGFLFYCYSTISPMTLHDKLDTTARKEMLYKLCCFHYVLVERSKYGFFGWTTALKISTVSLESAVNLFKDLCDRWADINFSLLYSNVLEVAYLSDIVDVYDLKVFQVLAQWIFVGLNKHDNHIIEGMYIRNYSGLVSSIIDQINKANFPKDPVVSGLADRVTRSFKWKRILDAKKTIKKVFIGEERHIIQIDSGRDSKDENADEDFQFETSDENDGTRVNEGIYRCIENEIRALEESKTHPKKLQYLRTLLTQSVTTINRIELQHLERPQAIIEQLKQSYSKKHRLGMEEITCYGTLKPPSATSENIEFTGCYICCATYNADYNCLQEADHCFDTVESCWVVVRRKQNTRNDAISVPLYHQDSSGQFTALVDVELDTNLPEQHWLLRGVKFASVKPLNIDPNLV